MRTHSYCQQKRFLSFCKIFDMGFDQSCTDTYIFIVLDGSIKRAASNQNWTHSAAAHPKNADTIKQWGYLHWLMEAIGLRREGKGACFTLGFTTGGPARCRSGPDVTVTLFSLMVWGCACPLVEGKSILAQSHACLLSSRRTDTQDTLTGSIYPAPATETWGHCREKRTLHISSLFEDGERCISRCPVLPVSWERERKPILAARPLFWLWWPH